MKFPFWEMEGLHWSAKMTHPEAQVLKFAFIFVVKIGRREETWRREAKILVTIKAMGKRKILWWCIEMGDVFVSRRLTQLHGLAQQKGSCVIFISTHPSYRDAFFSINNWFERRAHFSQQTSGRPGTADQPEPLSRDFPLPSLSYNCS